MPRRVVSNFSKGMVTDSISEEGAVAYLQDMYLRKKGELISRGPAYANTSGNVDTPANMYTVGYSGAQFHPNFGLSAVRGVNATWDMSMSVRDAQGYQLINAGLASVSGNDTPQEGLSITWSPVTEFGSNGATPAVNVNGVTHKVGGPVVTLEACYQSLNTGAETVYAGELGYVYKWGGQNKAPYSDGTVTIAANGVIVGSGTQTFLTSCDPGQYILIDGIGQNGKGEQRAHRITAIFSNTELAIETPLTADATARAYRIQSVAVLQSPSGVWNGDDEKPRSVGVVAYHQGKLCVAGVSDVNSGFNSVYDFDAIRFSGTQDEKGTTENGNYGYSHMDLWHPKGQVRVNPGVGGFIRGMVSMGKSLLVIKSHGLFTINGDLPAYNGNHGSIGLTTISDTIGAAGFRAWSSTPVGVVMANDTGLWIYGGDGLSSLTAGRIDTLWESFAKYATEFTVNVFGSLVVVGSAQYPDLPCVVWDFEKDYFWVGTNMSFQKTVTVYNQDDIWLGHVGFAGHVMNIPQKEVAGVIEARVHEVHTSDLSSILHWNTDPAGKDMDAAGINSGPAPIIATHPISLYDEGPGDGRVNNVGATMYSDRRSVIVLRPGESGVDQIVYSEHQSTGEDFGSNAGVKRIESTRWGNFLWNESGGATWGSTVVAGSSSHGGFVQEELPLTSVVGDYGGGYKNVRIPVEGFPSSPFVSVVLTPSDNQTLDNVSYQMRVQALYVDYEQASNFGTI